MKIHAFDHAFWFRHSVSRLASSRPKRLDVNWPAFDIAVRMRYDILMTVDSPLPPHLQKFVREQLATGRFQSESDLIHKALYLLEEQSHSPGSHCRVAEAGNRQGTEQQTVRTSDQEILESTSNSSECRPDSRR